MFTIEVYNEISGKSPFFEWLNCLDDQTQHRINARLVRVELGNLGDWKSVGKGVSELRFHMNSGYRIYFARDGHKIILLLCAGNKSSQKKDIVRAHKYLEDYQVRKEKA